MNKRSECKCACHTGNGGKHIVACCIPDNALEGLFEPFVPSKYDQAYLDSLEGLTVTEVQKKVLLDLDKSCRFITEGALLSAVARDDIIVTLNMKRVVVRATAGDPTQLVG